MDWKDVRDYKEMMACRVRMTAYHTAIKQLCADQVVCEVGVGLGPLSLMALKAGARRVYGIELDPAALRCATRIIADNGFGADRFIPVTGLSTQVELPERVDVVISETLDSMGVGENTALYMRDARQRHLKEDGVMLPAHIECVTALAQPAAWDAEKRFWTTDLRTDCDLNYSAIVPHILPMNRIMEVETHELLSAWAPWQRVNFESVEAFQTASSAMLFASRSGTVTGLARAFNAELGGGVQLSTRSGEPLTCWKQFFAPLKRPLSLQAGDCVYAEFNAMEPSHPGLDIETRITHVPAAAVPGFLRDLPSRVRAQPT